METKYTTLKNLIKAKAEFRRMIKNHRKTVKFVGERAKDITLYKSDWESYKDETTGHYGWKKVFTPVVISEITPDLANEIAYSDFTRYDVTDRPETIQYLYKIYGILRNERKTKKVKVWQDIVESPNYVGSELERDVNSWRD